MVLCFSRFLIFVYFVLTAFLIPPLFHHPCLVSVSFHSIIPLLPSSSSLFSYAPYLHLSPTTFPRTMPAIVNLLCNVVSTNTTISFSAVLPMVSQVSLCPGGGQRPPAAVAGGSKPSFILLLNMSLEDLGALLTLPCVLLSAIASKTGSMVEGPASCCGL